MPIDTSSIKAISFDCYGTLIDWEAGIGGALEPLFRVHRVDFDRAAVIGAFARHEREIEAGKYQSYAAVLGEVMKRIAKQFDLQLRPGESTALVASFGLWPAFAETPKCLKAIQRHYKVAIVSNVDDEMFAESAPRLGVKVSTVVTAEQVKSYKPASAHFEELLRRLALTPRDVLHVAESRYHDVAPASAMGFRTVWVNRHAADGGPSASGASEAKPDLEVRSLTELCEQLGVWG
jgi:2-haloacid dehalogenase